jgi:hypothetical protein
MDGIHRMARENNFDILRYFTAACQVEFALAEGNIPLALQNMQLLNERLSLEPDVLNIPMVLLQVKLLFAQGQKRRLGRLLPNFIKNAKKPGGLHA